MAKLPAIQFYPGDWLRDNVAGCSLAAQGLWLRMMILMHDGERYGYLVMNGSPIPPETLARRCGCDSLAQFETLLIELDSAHVPERTNTGIIFSRRMVRDEKKRRLCSAAGRRGGGNPTLKGHLKGRSKGTAKGSPEDEDEELVSLGKGERGKPFDRFWAEYPKKIGRGAAEKSWKVHVRNEFHDAIFASLAKHKRSAQWLRDDGQFIPNPATWLNQKRWNDEPKNNYAPRRESAVSSAGKHAPPWMAAVDEIKALLPDSGANSPRIAELGKSLTHEAWLFISSTFDGVKEQNPLKAIIKEANA